MIRDFLIQIQASEPTKGQIHPYFFEQATLAHNPVQITQQEQSQQYFLIDRRMTSRAIGVLQPLAHETQIHMTINLAQQVALGERLPTPTFARNSEDLALGSASI